MIITCYGQISKRLDTVHVANIFAFVIRTQLIDGHPKSGAFAFDMVLEAVENLRFIFVPIRKETRVYGRAMITGWMNSIQHTISISHSACRTRTRKTHFRPLRGRVCPPEVS